jgi:hypothetical protein
MTEHINLIINIFSRRTEYLSLRLIGMILEKPERNCCRRHTRGSHSFSMYAVEECSVEDVEGRRVGFIYAHLLEKRRTCDTNTVSQCD